MTTLSWSCNLCPTSASGPFDEVLAIAQAHHHDEPTNAVD